MEKEQKQLKEKSKTSIWAIIEKIIGLGGVCFVIFIIIYLIWGIPIKDSPAPGCKRYLIPGFQPSGGCFSKFAIINVKIEPSIDCLDIKVYNCLSPHITIKNCCGEDIVFQDGKILHKSKYCGEEYYLEGYEAIARYDTAPAENTNYKLNGTVRDRNFTIFYTVTKRLCD
jgi:hypothetical protein